MMKKMLIVALMAVPMLASAQDKGSAVTAPVKNPENKFAIANPDVLFLELIISTNMTGAQTIRVDFGREILTGLTDKEMIQQLSELRSTVFPSVPDAMNYLASVGYKFQQTYITYDKDSKPDATHMIFEKRMPRRQPDGARPRPEAGKGDQVKDTAVPTKEGPKPAVAPIKEKKK